MKRIILIVITLFYSSTPSWSQSLTKFIFFKIYFPKKLLFSLSLLLISVVGFGQCPSGVMILETQNDVDQFAVSFPNCQLLNSDIWIGDFFNNEGSNITNLDGLSQLQGFNGEPFGIRIQDCPQLQSIEGLSGFATIDHLGINGCEILTSLDGLQNLTSINSFLFLQRMPVLTSIFPLQNVQMMGQSSSPFPAVDFLLLPQVTTFSGLFAPDSVADGDIRVSFMNGITSLDGFGNLDIIDENDIEVFFNSTLQSLTGLEGIEGDVASLFLVNNSMLTDISALNAANFSTDNVALNIRDNNFLSGCDITSICNLLDSNLNATITIEDNALGCDTELEVIMACGLDLNIVSGEVLFDFEDNGCTSNQFTANNVLVEITNASGSTITSTNEDGAYTLFVNEIDTYSTSVVVASIPAGFEASPISEEITFTGFGETAVVDFCVSAINQFDDLKVTLLPVNEARPGFESSYLLVYENLGTQVLDGNVGLSFDNTRQDYLSSTPSENSLNDNLLTYNFTGLLPFENRTILVEMLNEQPPVNNDGDFLVFQAEINPITDDANPDDNVINFDQVMVNSFDPNDKQVAQGEEIFIEEVGNYLNYIVRFQNVGSASAINIRVEDELDENTNLESFRMLASSHEYRLEIIEENKLVFYFDDINLVPAEVNEPASNGYIAFKVRSNNDLVLGDSVENTAEIYFDFNEAIITNTVTTTVVLAPDEAPVAICQDQQVFLDIDGVAVIDAAVVGANSTDDNGIASYAVVPNVFSCANIGMNEVTLTVTDTIGNQSTCTAMVEVFDTIGPVIICVGDFDIEILEGETYTIPDFPGNGFVTASDNCLEEVSNITQSPIAGTMITGGIQTVLIFAEDNNGNITECSFDINVTEVLSVSEINLAKQITIFPNPISQILNIETDTSITLLNANIRSVLGETIITSERNIINVSNLASGIYFVEVVTNEGTLVKKIVKK